MNGVFTFSRKQKAWISGALARYAVYLLYWFKSANTDAVVVLRLLDLPPHDVTVTNVALFGTNIGCIVHLLIQVL